MLKIKETVAYKAKNGMTIFMKFNYERGTVSMMDKNHNQSFKPKEWMFTDRTREYLGGWVSIFRAMEEATVWADERLEAEAKNRETKKAKEFFDLMVGINELKDGK